ncbi:MAG: DUF202 domain-containing protein [Candidatus Rokubacteria bacterium]|nr:DUF202 domain-containing protein [Candidatus Rokubacteria bacterium]
MRPAGPRSWNQEELARERTAEAKRRTHLANERTYAAWVRTALALIALGVGIAGYFHVAGNSRGELFVTLGAAFSLGGALMAALATYGYRKTYRGIETGEYGGSTVLTVVLGAVPIALGLLALALIVIR